MTGGPGPLLVGLGVALILIGLLFWSGSLSWFGRLPGDIRIERDSVRVYVPLVSMLILSVALSLILYLVRRFL
ncbi:MAG TPA: DUF2905 domain-containing protein [Gemmatimonadales bacterium]|jgi:hypothetical protein|nr:DUF2905 domain-containing protein [Gemmatimonadales bacterium]